MANKRENCAACPDSAECQQKREELLTHAILSVVAEVAEDLELGPRETVRALVEATATIMTVAFGACLGPDDALIMRLQRVGNDKEEEVGDATVH